MRYHHVQYGPWVVAGLLLPGLITASVLILSGRAIQAPFALPFFLIAWLFHRLVVEIDSRRLRCSFGPGLIGRSFSLTSIVPATAVRNRCWYGWGIRRVSSCWMFNLQGLAAVELEGEGGKHFRIGTDEPLELVEAIRSACARPARAPSQR